MANAKKTTAKKSTGSKKKSGAKKNNKKNKLSFYEAHRQTIMFSYLIVSLFLLTVAFIPG